MMVGVVTLGQLENGLASLFGEPDDRAKHQRFSPVDFVEQPWRLEPRQLGRGRVIEVEGRVRVSLEKGRGHVDVDLALDRPPHHGRLVLAGREDRDLARVEDGGDAHGNGFARHVIFAEEIGGGVGTRDRVEVHEASTTVGARPRFVEPDVSGLADAENLKIDSARFANLGFIPIGGSVNVVPGYVAGWDVDVLRVDVDLREEVLPHEPMVGVNARLRHRVVLVEVERHHVGEAQVLVSMHPDQFAIHPDRRRSGGESEHRPLAGGIALVDEGRDSCRDQ